MYSQTRWGAQTHIVASAIKQTLANDVKLANKEQPFINIPGHFFNWLFMNNCHLMGRAFSAYHSVSFVNFCVEYIHPTILSSISKAKS